MSRNQLPVINFKVDFVGLESHAAPNVFDIDCVCNLHCLYVFCHIYAGSKIAYKMYVLVIYPFD